MTEGNVVRQVGGPVATNATGPPRWFPLRWPLSICLLAVERGEERKAVLSVDGLCPACKRRVADHLRSARREPESVPPGKVAVVNGRCVPDCKRAAQKLSWVALSEPMTPADYRERLKAKAIALEPCPGCGGALVAWGVVRRRLAEGEALLLGGLLLLRGRCMNRDCPVCTVTHYPCFVTPYQVLPTGEREAAVRAYAAEAECGEKPRHDGGLPGDAAWAPVTVMRWVRCVLQRAAAVTVGLHGVWLGLDDAAPSEVKSDDTRRGRLRLMFKVCDAVADLLRRAEGWTAPLPALALPRMVRPLPPTTLPVWT